MELSINLYIKKLLKKADFEYDKQTKSWCASVDDLPGTYAQANTKKEVKERLAEVIEDYILVSIYQRKRLPNFRDFSKTLEHAKACK